MINITINYGTNNSISREFADGTTLGTVLADRAIRAQLGFGQNVEGHLLSVPQSNDLRLVDGDRVYVYDKQCTKNALTRVTVHYGTGNSFTMDFEEPVTVGQVLANSTLRACLGFGQNVEGHVAGVPMANDRILYSGDALYVYDKQCTKNSNH